jgi:hypothetical protein
MDATTISIVILDTKLAARLVIVIFNKERMSAISELEATMDGISSQQSLLVILIMYTNS